MRAKALALVVAAALAACGRTPFPVLETQLDALKGQPASALAAKLGDPDARTTSGAETVYVWSSGNGAVVGLRCVLRAYADAAGKITRYDYDGAVAGCADYAHRLDVGYRFVAWPPV
jgi:ABC-type glycerol-3-phosphate transport system substrate-binding protein